MFNINSITLINFRSYKGTHKFEFPSAYGLYYLTGKNLLEPALGANGAGKSTFLDAITWCLYGRTARGLKANEVLSWYGGLSTKVVVELQVGEQTLTVTRTQKPNKLLLGDKPVDQTELETHLRLNYAAYMHSVMSAQFGSSFFSKSASDKLALFSDFMKLDFWLTKSDEAAKLLKTQEAKLAELRDNINRAEGQIEIIKDDIADLKKKSANFETERENAVEELKAEVLETYKAQKKANAAIEALSQERSDLAVEIEHERAKMLAAQKHRDDALDLIQKEAKRKLKCMEAIKDFKVQISNLNCLKGSNCHVCLQNVDHRHVARVTQDLRDSIDDEEAYLARSEVALSDLQMVLVRHKGDYESAANIVQEIQDEIGKVTLKINEKGAKSSSYNRRLDDLARALSKEENAKNPHEATLVEKTDRLRHLRKRIEEANRASEEGHRNGDCLAFWVKGFKRIRLFIIEQAFRTLELEVNNCLAQLGMTDWQVTFDVERENKSGGITKGFVVFIKGPNNKEPVRWENWSGGETQRLQLAGDLGLSNLIMQQVGLRNEIEFYDEPSTHLSPEGMLDLADTLHERAVSEEKRIWIVDHAVITNFGAFEGVITARKDKNGSSITID